jgi:ArsR family transcriptional regulator
MKDLISLFKTLSDETRLKILKLLEGGELCVCDIVAALDTIQPKVSFHLNILKEAGLIIDRRQGKWIRYRLNDLDLFKRFLLLTILEKIPDENISDDRKRLKKFLEEKERKKSRKRNKIFMCCS